MDYKQKNWYTVYDIYTFLIFLKRAYRFEYTSIKIRIKPSVLPLLSKLYKLGLIAGYCLEKRKLYTTIHSNTTLVLVTKIFIRYHTLQPTFHNIDLISRPSHKVFITYKELAYVTKFWESNQSYFLISTSRGVLSYKEAMKAKVGGFVLARIS